jgi:hypothetical protein
VSEIKLWEDGVGATVPSGASYYTSAQADAQFVAKNDTDTGFRLSPTTELPQLYNPDTGKWHSIALAGAAGSVGLVIDQTGEDE